MIRSKVPTQEYRDNWDEIFKTKGLNEVAHQEQESYTKPLSMVRKVEPFKSPIDGTVITSSKKLVEHMKKHDVVPFEPNIKRKHHFTQLEEKKHRTAVLRDAFEHARDKSRYFR